MLHAINSGSNGHQSLADPVHAGHAGSERAL